jgi:hypothetical protein
MPGEQEDASSLSDMLEHLVGKGIDVDPYRRGFSPETAAKLTEKSGSTSDYQPISCVRGSEEEDSDPK